MSSLVVSKSTALARAARIVPYLAPEEVRQLVAAAAQHRAGERDSLLVRLLFATGLRISEALSLTPAHLGSFEGRPVLRITGKGKKPRLVACPQSLADALGAYAWRKGLRREERFFPINRQRAHQILQRAGREAGLPKRVYPHLLRHSDAIERLRRTGNPRALQLHLGHSTLAMTMRYLSTLQAEDALRIQQDAEVDV